MQFPTLCKCLSTDACVQCLLPLFQALSSDGVWSVRKATADVLPSVSHLLPPHVRQSSLLPVLDRLREDLSSWVKASALMSFGPFLTTLDADALGADLLGDFTKVISQHCGVSDDDVLLSCAHAFPGVALKAGVQGWGVLRKLYWTLMDSEEEGVRRTLACSAHELAGLLGQEAVEEDVLPAVLR